MAPVLRRRCRDRRVVLYFFHAQISYVKFQPNALADMALIELILP